jgi:putative phosphoribosyl transferase
LEVRGRIINLMDDGLATGASMRAAVMALRRRHPARIIVAVPVGAAETCEQLRKEADEVICGQCRLQFGAVSAWYEDFTQMTDAEVVELLDRATLAAQQH